MTNGYSSSSFPLHRATCICGPDINVTRHLPSSVHTDSYFKTFHIT